MPDLKLLLDENIGVKTADFLRSKSYDIKSALEDCKGVSDEEILGRRTKRIGLLLHLIKTFAP